MKDTEFEIEIEEIRKNLIYFFVGGIILFVGFILLSFSKQEGSPSFLFPLSILILVIGGIVFIITSIHYLKLQLQKAKEILSDQDDENDVDTKEE